MSTNSLNSKGYHIYRDRKRNLIACPEDLDLSRDIIYLSAHMDMVDADPLEWDEPFFPFSLYEDDGQMMAGMKTSRQIGEDLETTLPISEKDTFFIVLENNITVSDPSILSFYTAERGNFVIRVSETMDRLRSILSRLEKWNPVSIRPDAGTLDEESTVLTQKGGMSARFPGRRIC